MIIKSTSTIEVESTEINSLIDLLQGLDLPEGAKLSGISEKTTSVPGPDGTTGYITKYCLILEWEEER